MYLFGLSRSMANALCMKAQGARHSPSLVLAFPLEKMERSLYWQSIHGPLGGSFAHHDYDFDGGMDRVESMVVPDRSASCAEGDDGWYFSDSELNNAMDQVESMVDPDPCARVEATGVETVHCMSPCSPREILRVHGGISYMTSSSSSWYFYRDEHIRISYWSSWAGLSCAFTLMDLCMSWADLGLLCKLATAAPSVWRSIGHDIVHQRRILAYG